VNILFLWQSTFADGIIAAATVIDAQVNYELPKLKSTQVRVSNIGGRIWTSIRSWIDRATIFCFLDN
jgi:hypothetical protein